MNMFRHRRRVAASFCRARFSPRSVAVIVVLLLTFWALASPFFSPATSAHSPAPRDAAPPQSNVLRQRTDGPGVPPISFDANEVGTVVSVLNEANGAPGQLGSVAMHNGYLAVVYSRNGTSDGGFSFFDISNPRSPRLVFQKEDGDTAEIREAHGFGFSSDAAGDYVALQATHGIQIWDWSDVTNPRRLSYLRLPGIEDSGYALGVWWLFWQAPYVYVGGSGNGLYIVDASDPRNPVLVDRGAGRPNPIPISQTGGFRIGPVFAVGNVLMASSNSDEGLATFDISDPKNPVLLRAQVGGIPRLYSTMLNGDRILAASIVDKRLYVYDISDPTQLRFVNATATDDLVSYATFQDGFAHVGASANYAKFDLRNDTNYPRILTASSELTDRDEDIATPLGNLVVIADDNGVGSAIVPHQAAPDTTPPRVNMVNPKPSSVNQARSTRIGLTFTDMIDLRSVHPSTFIVRPRGGTAIAGTWSHQTNIVNFAPAQPLAPNTVYEVVVPAGGVKDFAGNAIDVAFASQFSTGNGLDQIMCEVAASAPTTPGQTATWSARSDQQSVQYAWNFGDGSPTTAFGTTSTMQHSYAQPGHYTVRVTVRKGAAQSSCATTHTTYRPPTAVPPTNSGTMLLDESAGRVWVVNPDNDSVTAINAANFTKHVEQPVGKNPRTLAQAPDGTIWVVNEGDATISVLDRTTANIATTISLPVGSRPYGIAFAPNGAAVYVSLQGTGRVVRLNPQTRTVSGSVDVGATPRGIAITADGARVLVTRFISPSDHGEVMEIDAATFAVTRVFTLAADPGPDTELSGRGIPNYLSSLTIAPDGRRVWIPSKKDNTERGLSQDGQRLTFESTVRTIVSQLDLHTQREDLATRIDLNDRDLAVAVRFSPRGDYVFVATQGSNIVDVYDAYSRQLMTSIESVGLAPQGLSLTSDGHTLFVHNFMSRSVAVYDVAGIVESRSNRATQLAVIHTVGTEKLSVSVLRGKQLFYNANDPRMNRDGYISCASCHVDGGQDGRAWDFTDRGEGVRNTTALVGRRGTGQGRVHWTGNFDEIQDFEHDIRSFFGGQGFMSDALFNTGTRDTPLGDLKAGSNQLLDALAAYLRSLTEVGRSPYRNGDGSLTSDGEKGKEVFQRFNCVSCHVGPDFTDSASGVLHDVGTIKPASGQRMAQPLTGLDTPTLKGLWNTAPYLHDGSALTLMDVFGAGNVRGRHGPTARMSAQELQQLVAYLLQVDDGERIVRPPMTNLLSNPAFELDDDGDQRPDNWSNDSRVTRSVEAMKTGTYGLRFAPSNGADAIIGQSAINLQADVRYKVSGWVRIPATSDSFTFKVQVQWRDATNAVLRTDVVRTFSAATSSWKQALGTYLPPAGTTNAVVYLVASSLHATVYVDDVSLQVDNMVLNGGFEADTDANTRPDGWSGNDKATRTNVVVHSGSYAMQQTATDNGSYTVKQIVPDVLATATYTFNGWVKIPATSDSFTFKLQVTWRNAANGVLRSDVVRTFNAATSDWVQATGTFLPPAGTTNAVVYLVASSLNATVYVDDVSLQVANMVLNGDFEADTDANTHPDAWSINDKVIRSGAVTRSGSYAMQHAATDNGSYTIKQSVPNVLGGQAYAVTAWVNIPSTVDTFTYRLMVEWIDINGASLGKTTVATYRAPTSGWTPIVESRIAPHGAKRAEVQMVLSDLNAKVYVDDLVMRP